MRRSINPVQEYPAAERARPGPAAPPSAGAMALLGSRRFGPLFATQFLSAFNDNALKNALVLMIAYRADAAGALSAGLLIPLAGGLFILPFFLCSASAGALADRSDKARLIRIIKLIEIAVMAVAAAGVIGGSAMLLLALLFVMGVEAAFFGPIKYAILPDLLAPHELLLGNALVEAGTFLAILFGTIAGMLIATGHGEITVAALIIGVAVAAGGISLAIPPIRPAASPARFEWNFAAATARAIGQATERPAPFRAMLGISWFWLAGALYLSQFPTYVRFVLGSEEAVVTLFLAVFSVGVGAGSMLCNRLLRGRVSARTVPWGMLGLALFSIDLCLASPDAAAGAALTMIGGFLAQPANWRILADLFGIAASGGAFILPLYTLLQTGSDEARRAQTIGANNIINAAAMVLSAVVTMALVAAGVSVPGLFLLTGIASLGVAALFWRMAPGLSAGPEAARMEI
jgi:acyl-[acyl-carrier-protein]-phospholipid O-acyltransferase/long-chain-fatty-acid--[acyl-carrier-protein] ligase